MKSYEGVFIFPPESTADARKEQYKNLDEVLAKFQAHVLQKTEWGKRPLGYPLKKFREGFFWILDFRMLPAKMTEFRKTLELQEDLLKFMLTIKNTKSEKKPAEKGPVPAAVSAPSSAVPRS